MKKLTINLFSVVIAAVVLVGCNGLSKMVDNASTVKYDVTPSPLETHGGEVEMSIKASFPEKYFNKKATVTFTPIIKYDGGQTEYESKVLQGEAVEANNQVIAVAGGEATFSGKVTYKPEMLQSELVIAMSAQIGDKDPLEIPAITIAKGVIATPTLVKNDPKAALMGDKFERIIPEKYDAEILYVINRDEVRNSELKKGEIVEFQDIIKSAASDERVKIKGANISSYASPDGALDLNTKLSGKRGTSAERYLSRTLKSLKVSEASAKEFLKIVSTAEDWDGFKKEMEGSEIKDKELILRVLSMHSDPAVREQEIKNIAEAFDEIKVKVLPQLRRSQMSIDVDKIGYSDEELTDLAKSNPDTLNIEEILYAATLFEANEDKLEIYQKAAANFPQEVRAKNNVGFVQLAMGDNDAAEATFVEAKAINDNEIVKNNQAVCAMLKDDIEGAEALLTAAVGAGDVANYNLGIIKIKQGDYAAAVNYFGNKPSFNAALAQCLNVENEKAVNTLGELGDSDDAMVYYLKAVIGARDGNMDLLVTNLRRAIELDSELKAYALKDAEFDKYQANEAFMKLVQ